jgi:zinc protease
MEYTEFSAAALRGIAINRPNERVFECTLSIDAWNGNESVRSAAIALLYSDALVSGCEGYTRDELTDEISLLGGTLEISLSAGRASFTLKGLREKRAKLMAIFAKVLLSPSIPARELARIKTTTINGLKNAKEDARSKAHMLFWNALYEKNDRLHSFSEEELIAAIPSVSRTELLAFHAQVMSGIWIATLITASEEADSSITLLHSLRGKFAEEARMAPARSIRRAPQQLAGALIESRQNIEFSIGAHLPLCYEDADYYPFLFGLMVLGKWGGFAGRLMSTVREKEGLTYGIYARAEMVTKLEEGDWRIMTFFAPDKALQGLTSTLREIRLIKEKGITKEEFERFKTIDRTGEALLHDYVLRLAADIHNLQLAGLSLAEMKEWKRSRERVKREEVNAALKKYLDLSKLAVGIAGPISTKEKELTAVLKKAAVQ